MAIPEDSQGHSAPHSVRFPTEWGRSPSIASGVSSGVLVRLVEESHSSSVRLRIPVAMVSARHAGVVIPGMAGSCGPRWRLWPCKPRCHPIVQQSRRPFRAAV